jgi:hypothetical protein
LLTFSMVIMGMGIDRRLEVRIRAERDYRMMLMRFCSRFTKNEAEKQIRK